MNHRLDSAHIIAALGSVGGFVLANFDRIAAALCALGGLAYTLWKWHREAHARRNKPFPRPRAENHDSL